MNTRASSAKATAAKASTAKAGSTTAQAAENKEPVKTPAVVAASEPAAQPVVAAGAGLDLMKYAGAGSENVGKDDVSIPFVRILQTNSPELDETNAKFVDGAKAGMLFNTITKELYDGKEGALFQQCYYERKQLRWAPRGEGAQGFRGEVSEVDALKAREAGKLVEHEGRTYFTEDGKVDDKKNDRLVDTRLHYGIFLSKDGAPRQALMSLVSTSIKPSRVLNTLLTMQKSPWNTSTLPDPTFVHAIRITTVRKSNDKGSWFIPDFRHEEALANPGTNPLVAAGAAFRDALTRGEVKVDLARSGEEVDDGAAATDPDKF